MKALGQGRHIPAIAKTFLRDMVKEDNKPQDKGRPKMKVGYFMGCATDLVYSEIGLKIIDFLTKRGVEVVVPKDQNCCGAAVYFSGDFETGRAGGDEHRGLQGCRLYVTACGTSS